MTRSVPQAMRPALEGAVFDNKGSARTLKQAAWCHVQAMKADRPRLSACTSRFAISASFQGASLCLGDLAGRSADGRTSRVLMDGADAPTLFVRSRRDGVGGAPVYRILPITPQPQGD